MWALNPKVSLHLWRMLNEATKTMVPVAPAQSSGSGDAGQKYVWHVGSLFSGSDIALVVGHYVCALWKTIAGVDVEIQCVFQVEKDEEKRAHLLNHTCATHTFDDVSKVASQQRLHCFRTNQDVLLPWAHTLFSGFPCTNRAKTSRTSHLSKGCVQKGTGVTGKGFGDTFAIVERHRPRLVILENVVGLLEQPGEDDPEEVSDADWIVEQFVSIGYWAAWFRFDAREYGSFVVRERI